MVTVAAAGLLRTTWYRPLCTGGWQIASLSVQRKGGSLRFQGFPDNSAGKESTCKAGDPGSIPGSGSSAGEGIGYSLQYSWTFLMVKLVKNLPAVWETWVHSLGWEDLLEKGMATHSSILAWRILSNLWSL